MRGLVPSRGPRPIHRVPASEMRIIRKTIPPAVFAWILTCVCCFFLIPRLPGQGVDDSIVAKHVRLRIPTERQWLGRECITELERCWEFLDGATGGKMPARVIVVIGWRDSRATVDPQRGVVSIGMDHPAAANNPKAFLLHGAARELARLGLISLSSGGLAREENLFLAEGMAEILAHEFSNTTRRLSAAWAISHYLDRIRPLGLPPQGLGADRFTRHDLGSAAPGITFLIACREQYGRDRVTRLLESLAKRGLAESIATVFRTQSATVEAEWLKRVRSYQPAEITVLPGEEGPRLERVMIVPEMAKAGSVLELRLFTRNGANLLDSSGIFVVDEGSGKVSQGVPAGTAGSEHTRFELPVEATRQAGTYRIRIMAADDGGNLRIWEATYQVQR